MTSKTISRCKIKSSFHFVFLKVSWTHNLAEMWRIILAAPLTDCISAKFVAELKSTIQIWDLILSTSITLLAIVVKIVERLLISIDLIRDMKSNVLLVKGLKILGMLLLENNLVIRHGNRIGLWNLIWILGSQVGESQLWFKIYSSAILSQLHESHQSVPNTRVPSFSNVVLWIHLRK